MAGCGRREWYERTDQVGGAQRNDRKKRQMNQRPGAVVTAARRAPSDRWKIIVTVAVVVLIGAALITWAVISNNKKNITEGQSINPQSESVTVPAKRDGGTVLVGKDGAKVTIDVYEDFLCPYCGKFEQTYHERIDQKVQAGAIKVRYHMLPLLNDRSDPPGYSLDAANAALLSADAGKFVEFHNSLYALGTQPEEGSRGYDDDQLIKLGKDIGITSPAFAAGIKSNKYDSLLDQELQTAEKVPYLQQDYGNGQVGFGTPTVVNGQKVIDISNPGWLAQLAP
jgi:protein-disulfide isomerase